MSIAASVVLFNLYELALFRIIKPWIHLLGLPAVIQFTLFFYKNVKFFS